MIEAVLCIGSVAMELSQWLLPSSLIAFCRTNKAINNAYSSLIIRRVKICEFKCKYVTQTISTVQTVNGIEHGKYKLWYDIGGIQSETDYVDGKIHGKCKEWYANGQLEEETHYVNDKKHGKETKWYDNSRQKKSETEYVNGKKHGKKIVWFDTGVLWVEEDYINGICVKRQW